MNKVIKTEASDKSFSALGGLIIFRRLFDQLNLAPSLKNHLPSTKRNVYSGLIKFEALVLGFLAGKDHLDDWEDLNSDAGFISVVSRCYCPKSLGDFLRAFSELGLHQLQGKLIELSFELRSKLNLNSKNFILDLDSTCHQQYGKKMEGVEVCYKNFAALDSILAFDEHGFQYWHEVRPGATYTSNGAGQIIHEVLSRLPHEYKKKRKIVRADSGFFNSEFFNSCSIKGAGFVCAAKKTSGIKDRIIRVKNWEAQNRNSKGRILATGGRECEIGHTSYHTKGFSRPLRLVVIRAKKFVEEGVMFQKHLEYDYFCFVTNMGAHEYSSTDLIKLYRSRGHAENFIREQKNGFDLKHYPCQKLKANKAFGLIAAFAYTLMRFVSLSKKSKKKIKNGEIRIPHFAKKIRTKLLSIPVQVLRHAGSTTFRFNRCDHGEIIYWLEKLKFMQFRYS